MSLTTFCINCRHHRMEGDSDIWYDHLCGATAVQKTREQDPVTGKFGYASKNDLGGLYLSERPEPYCREINHGNCPHFDSQE